MMDHTPTSVPRTRRAVTALYHQATEPEAEPVVIDAAYDHGRPAHRQAVREVITAAPTRASGIVR